MGVSYGSLTDWVTIARSGATVDGRTLDAAVLKAMAANYNPCDYTAVVNYEHVYGNLGTVRELRAVETDGKVELQARIRPNKYYFLYNSEQMGLFFSIEYIKNFAKTGQPYLVGLAATDKPASLGTTEQHFSAAPGGGEENVIERGECLPIELTVSKRNNPAEMIREVVSDVLAKFLNTKNEENKMTKEEFSATVEAALAPFKTQLDAITAKLSAAAGNNGKNAAGDKNDSGSAGGDNGENAAELSGDYKKLQEGYAALTKSVEALSAKLDAALSKQPGKAEKVTAAAAETETGFIL